MRARNGGSGARARSAFIVTLIVTGGAGATVHRHHARRRSCPVRTTSTFAIGSITAIAIITTTAAAAARELARELAADIARELACARGGA